MLSKREFSTFYDEAVTGIKELKGSNDRFNKNVGVVNEIKLYHEMKSQSAKLDETCHKIEDIIAKLEKSYLDPDSARKIGMVRQQLRIQRDRRAHLTGVISEITKTEQFKRNNAPPQNTPSNKNKNSKNNHSKQKDANNYYKRKNPINELATDSEQHQTQVALEGEGQDYEMDRKLLAERGRTIREAHKKMMQIKGIVEDASGMVNEQGGKLDIIEQNLFKADDNVSLANTELKEANLSHNKKKRKVIILSLVLMLIVGISIALVSLL